MDSKVAECECHGKQIFLAIEVRGEEVMVCCECLKERIEKATKKFKER